MNTELDPSLERHLARELRARTVAADPSPTPVTSIVARARRRQARRRAGTLASTGLLVAMAIGTGVVMSRSGTATRDDALSEVPATEDAAPAPVETPEVYPASDIVWSLADVPPNEAPNLHGFDRRVFGSGPFYGVATQPGLPTRAADQVWQSNDGLSWRSISEPDDSFGKLAFGADRLYSVGTAAFSADQGWPWELKAQVSNDGGATWQPASGMPDTKALAALPHVQSAGVVLSGIAAHGDRVLVTAKVEMLLDLASIDPAFGNGWSIDPDGRTATTLECEAPAQTAIPALLESVSPSPTTDAAGRAQGILPPTTVTYNPGPSPTSCEAGRTIVLADVLDPKVIAELNRIHFLVSDDGLTYREVDLAGQQIGIHEGGFAMLDSTDDGFVYMSTTLAGISDSSAQGAPPTTRVFTSPDGETWTQLPDLPEATSSNMLPVVGKVGGRLTLVRAPYSCCDGRNEVMAEVLTFDGSTWSSLDVTSHLGLTTSRPVNVAAAIGPSGVSVAVTLAYDPVAAAAPFTVDAPNGYRVSVEPGEPAVVTDAAGAVVPGLYFTPIDGNVYGLIDPQTGDELGRWDLTTLPSAPPPPEVPGDVVMIHSVDGRSWTHDKIGAVIPGRLTSIPWVSAVDLAGDRTIARVVVEGAPTSNGETTVSTYTVVGVPPS